jgi:hypothetical protein
MPAAEAGGASGGAAWQQNSAPNVDIEKLARQALVVAMMRERSNVVRSTELELAVVQTAYAIYNADDVDVDLVLKQLEKYAIKRPGIYVVVPDDAVDVIKKLDEEFIEAMSAVLFFADEICETKDHWNILARTVEKYVTDKITDEYDREWSAAKELLTRAADAGFNIEVKQHADGQIEYRITAPTGDSTSVYYTRACGDFEALWYVKYRFKPCTRVYA